MDFPRTLGLLALCACAAVARSQSADPGPGDTAPAVTSAPATAGAVDDGSMSPSSSTSTTPSPAVPPLLLPPERRWRLGLAAGYGRRTNPLIQSDDIPVLIDVDIAWFGKRWFFDNGDLGFELADNEHFTTNIVARVNSDRTFFSKTNTKFVTFTQLSGGVTVPIVEPGSGTPSVNAQPLKPPHRDYAIELGFETLFDGDWGAATVRAFHDVSGTHDGYEVGVSYDYRVTRGRFSLSPSLGLAWKDERMTDYYWGVHDDEASITLQSYHAHAGLSWEAGLRSNYYVTKNVRLAAAVNYERLQTSVADSPLVEQPYVFGYFAGLAWTF